MGTFGGQQVHAKECTSSIVSCSLLRRGRFDAYPASGYSERIWFISNEEGLVLKLTTIASTPECGAGTCPMIHLAQDGQLYVQGRRIDVDVRATLVLAADEEVVVISVELLQQAIASLKRGAQA